MKRLSCLILSLLILFGLVFKSYAYVIDGNKKGTEWENGETILLLDREESNNNINFALVNYAIENSSIFLCFNFIDKNIADDVSMSGVSLIIESSDEFIVTVGTSPAVSDSIDYLFEGAVSYDNTKGGICEIRVGSKYGLPSEISAKARFIDSNGSYSNVYYFTIKNSTSYYPIYEPDEYTEPIKTETTTNSNTTKPTTDKTVKEEKTTKKSSSKTTKKNSSGLLGLIFNDKEETTVKQTKSAGTTKKTAEKTKKSSAKQEKTTAGQTSTVTVPTSIIYVSASNVPSDVTARVSTTEGTKYKLLTALFGGVTIVTVAVLGTIGANKKAIKKNKDE